MNLILELTNVFSKHESITSVVNKSVCVYWFKLKLAIPILG